MEKEESFDELMARLQGTTKQRKRPTDEEHRIQCACVRWFSIQYPELRGRLFAVPNGGKRDKVTAGKLKAEGAYPGVSDLILLKPKGQYGALLIEMKTAKGHQSEGQVEWEKIITAQNEYKYVVCHSLDEFMSEVNSYLKQQ